MKLIFAGILAGLIVTTAAKADEMVFTSWGGTTHFSPWSYDRHVPLAFYGAPFIPGEYHGRVAPVDLAVTFASLAGVNFPSAASGRVLKEALKPVHSTPQ